jgi:ABC-type microcin C transport system duplicated ATPase subunit YejF
MNRRHEKDQENPILAVEGLRKAFPIRTGFLQRVTDTVKAVDGVSFAIDCRPDNGIGG